jgi:hypothetical protein
MNITIVLELTRSAEYMSLCYWPDLRLKSRLVCKPFIAKNISSHLPDSFEKSQYILVCPR